MSNDKITIPDEVVMTKIFIIRGQKVMLDRDLAELYEVETKVLKQAVKRNIDIFPVHFMFELTEGRGFSKDYKTDKHKAFIINETAAKRIGWQNPIGKKFILDNEDKESENGEIIGVVKDFHFYTMTQDIEPLALQITDRPYRFLSMQIDLENITPAKEYIELLGEKYSPDFPLRYEFMEEWLNSFYGPENRLAKIINIFSILAILLACMGLFGLTSFVVEQKTKEIGIRKALGARISGITLLLSGEFTKWILIANLIAWPVSYILMNKWLNSFSYKTPLSIWVFIAAAIIALLIALLTISIQTINAARKNPVNSLKYE